MNNDNLIRKFRIERNITQKDLAHNLCSRGTLSKFENGDSNINANLLFNLLERMNITYEEYAHYKNDDMLSKKEQLKKEFSNKILNNEHSKSYLEDIHNEYILSKDIYYLFLYCQGMAIYNKLNNKNINLNNEIDVIKKHLDSVETWGVFELTMYTNTLYLFDYNQTIDQFDKIYSHIDKFSNYTRMKHIKIHFLVNSIILSFEHNRPKLTNKYLDKLFESSDDVDLILGRIFWKFFTGLLNLKQGKSNFDAEVTLSWLRGLGHYDLANHFSEIQESFQLSDNKKSFKSY